MPSSKTRRRRARAVKRFLIQILVLAVLVAACAFVILRTGGLAPGRRDNQASTPAQGGESAETPTPEPEVTPTPRPTPAPTPEPTAYPEDQLSQAAGVKIPDAKLDSPVKARIEHAEPSPGDRNNVVIISGWAFLPGKDAAATETYVILTSVSDSESEAYLARVTGGGADVAEIFADDKGKNLDQARFECAIDVSSFPDDYYSVSLLLVNGKTREHMAIVEPPVDLDIRDGAAL